MNKLVGRSRNPDSAVIAAEDWSEALLVGKPRRTADPNGQIYARRRILLVTAVMVLMLLGLVARLFFMQVVSAENYLNLANGNRVRLIVQYAARGNILDTKGRVLASNTLSYQLSATPYLLSDEPKNQNQDIKRVAQILKSTPNRIKKAVFDEGPEFTQPLVVAEKLNRQQALRLETVIPRLEGFSLDLIPIRKYDARGALAHVIGYSGRVSEADLEANKDTLLPTDFIGKSGVEQSFDDHLRGKNGWLRVEVDALGRPVRVLGRQNAVSGKDLRLSIDRDVQISLTDAIAAQMQKANVLRASGVAMNPINGQVLAVVSLPSYDNNLFASGISQTDFSSLNNNPNQPLYNKAIAGGYSSGSTIKPLVASAALQEGVVTDKTVIVDTDHIAVGSFRFRSWRPGGLGPQTVRSAIAWSSNIYFMTVGGGNGPIAGLGEERLTSYYSEFGLGQPTGIPLPGEITGRVPDRQWKLDNKGEDWFIGDSYNISIGQGDLLITPLQLSVAHSAIANGGKVVQPQLKDNAKTKVKNRLDVSAENLQIVREGMRQVLTGGTTSEGIFGAVPVKVAGKSGTAETDPEGGRRPHAWYSAFAPYEDPEILVTVMLEEGVGGSTFAAPAIAQAMATYFNSNP